MSIQGNLKKLNKTHLKVSTCCVIVAVVTVVVSGLIIFCVGVFKSSLMYLHYYCVLKPPTALFNSQYGFPHPTQRSICHPLL